MYKQYFALFKASKYRFWKKSPEKRKREETGASLLEYTLLVALISLVCLTGVQAVGQETADSYCDTTIKGFLSNQISVGATGYYNPEEHDCCVDFSFGSFGGTSTLCVKDS